MSRSAAQSIVIAGCVASLLLGSGRPALASDTPSGYHWARKQTQFTLMVGDDVKNGWDSRLRQAIDDWNANGTVTLKEVNGSTNAQRCADTDGMVEVCNFDYGTQEGWLGLTRLFFNDTGDHIASVTVQLNDSFFDQANGQYNNEAARKHTICHELGHSMGLGHTTTTSCMNPSQDSVFHNLTPIKKDFRTLAKTYDHKDSTTTVAGKQPKDKTGKHKHQHRKRKNENGTQGQEKRAERNSFFSPTALPAVPSGLTGSDTEIVQHLADGRKMVTFITWAKE
jgi:predicted Zn-dependent protease